MPQVQVIDTTPRNPDPTGVEKFFSRIGEEYKNRADQNQIGNLIGQYQENRQQANAWEDLQLGLEKSNISPGKRLETQKSLNEMKKNIIAQDKTLNRAYSKNILSNEDRDRQKTTLLNAGWPEHAAEQYLDSPPGVKQSLQREHAALVERGFRQPINQNQLNQSNVSESANPIEQPIVAEEPIFVDDEIDIPKKEISNDKNIKSQEEWPEPEIPNNLTQAERVKWENNNEKENNKELKDARNKLKTTKTNDTLIKSMQQTSKYLPSGIQKLMIDPKTGDIRPEAQLAGLVNPETQLYTKNLKQWLKGAKDFFGARVTNFDVSSFMAQLPSLLNSEQGRKLILKQMQYVNDLEGIYNKTTEEAFKKYGRNANYNQIAKIVDDKVSLKEPELLGKINNLVEASKFMEIIDQNPDKFRGHTVMQDREGKFKAVPNDKVEYLKSKKWRDF